LSLADERRSRRFRTRDIDPLLFRVFLALLGTGIFALMALGLGREPNGLEGWVWLLVGVFVSFGCVLWYWALFGSDAAVEKWSYEAGSHGAVALIILVAWPLAWAIRKSFRPDST
jgi:hypothetical protein